MRDTRRWVLALCAAGLAGGAASSARAQGLPGELAVPGDTVATSVDADSARLNAGAVPLARAWSARFTHASELSAHDTALNGDALSVTAPLILDVFGSLGLTWLRPEAPGARGNLVSADVGVGYAVTRRMGLGARVRVMAGEGDAAFAAVRGGAAALDVGWAWRPESHVSLGISLVNLLGPVVPGYARALGLERAAVAGVGVRPAGTDWLTVGVDGAITQAGEVDVRAGARVRLPALGYVRAEGVLELPNAAARAPTPRPDVAWRAAVGLELVYGQASVAGGALVGGAPSATGPGAPLGFWASARVEPERDRGLPEPGVVVEVSLNGDLTARAVGELVLRLERLKSDPTVRGVLFAPRGNVGNVANAEELREAFARLRAAGKRVACHLLDASGATYFACTGAETITMDPAGTLRLVGLQSGAFFLGDALRDIGVRADFLRVGAWKSAPEQFTRRGASPEARAQEEQLLDDAYAALLAGVSSARNVDLAAARALVEGGPYTARDAHARGLVDALGPRDVAERAAGRSFGAAVVPMESYPGRRPNRWAPGPAVAVLYLDGDMVQGDSSEIPLINQKFVGDRTVVTIVRALAESERVRAIVLRVDTGGGDALAAEMMWREIARAARRKPLVVSFGSVAASGGYYVAAPAREIFADAATLTGSIGIFFGKVDFAPLALRADVGVELLRRGARADMDSLFRPFTDDERDVLGRILLEDYNVFLQRVAEGRHMTTAQVDAVGQGRVFSGSRGREVGLVDRIGGLALAVERARALGGLGEDSDVLQYPALPGGLLEQLVSLLGGARVDDGPAQPPVARLFADRELLAAARWLTTVANGGQAHAMALTEWPLLPP